MSQMFVVRLRYRLLWAGIVLIPFCCGISSAQEIDATGQQLYLLSATPTEHSDKTYPANLYQVGADRKLKLVREVVPQSEGVRFVQAWCDAIFVIYPHDVATTVSMVHTGEPQRSDELIFNPDAIYVARLLTAVAEPSGSSIRLLLPLSPDFTDPSKAKLLSVSSGSETGLRLRHDEWGTYAALRAEGTTGGPAAAPGLTGSVSGENLEVSVYGHPVIIETLPPSLRRSVRRIFLGIVAASQKYLILMVQRTKEEMASPNLGKSREAFVLDRTQRRWKTVEIDGNAPGPRLFSPWLATIVGMWNPNHEPGPGRGSERGSGTDRLPNVQEEYATYGGRWILRPGILVLQNLADGRKIRIETGQEDSEVLWAGSESVLYRINDAIYEARIVGDQLRDSKVVVKDEDVPEVHWVFWAK
jgi:hypothetical protein